MSLMWIDWVIFAVLLVSAVVSIARGAVRECVALVTWIAGIYAAFVFTPRYQHLLSSYIETPEFQYGITFMAILIIVLIIGGLLGFFLSKLVGIMGLSGIDKIFGIVFGVLRGLILVVVAVAVGQFTVWSQRDWWQDSVAIPKVQPLADRLINWTLTSSWLPDTEKTALQEALTAQQNAKRAQNKNKDWFSTGENGKTSAPAPSNSAEPKSAAPTSTDGAKQPESGTATKQ